MCVPVVTTIGATIFSRIIVILTASCDYYLAAIVYTIQLSVFMFISVIPPVLSPQDGQTALMLASDSGHIDVVQLLLFSGAQVDLQDEVRHSINL